MHIYIIGRHLEPAVISDDPLLEQGRRWVLRGHRVTVLTGSSGNGLKLGRKKIGLLHREGMTVVVLNMPLDDKISAWRRHIAYMRFSAFLVNQGQMLPKPDFIVAVMPPPEIAWSVLKLKVKYCVPLMLEFREALPDYVSLKVRALVKLVKKFVRRSEERVLEEAAQIIALDENIASNLRQHVSDQGKSKVNVIDKGLDEMKLFEAYERVFREAKNK